MHSPRAVYRPELLDAVAADADVPVVEVDGGVAVAGDDAQLVADVDPIRRPRDAEPAVLVGGALAAGAAGSSQTSGGPE